MMIAGASEARQLRHAAVKAAGQGTHHSPRARIVQRVHVSSANLEKMQTYDGADVVDAQGERAGTVAARNNQNPT